MWQTRQWQRYSPGGSCPKRFPKWNRAERENRNENFSSSLGASESSDSTWLKSISTQSLSTLDQLGSETKR